MRPFFLRDQEGDNAPLTVNFGTPKVVKEVPAKEVTANKIEIVYTVDNPTTKTVTAFTKGQPGQITLWEGEAYDAIGQWTDTDVVTRINELFQ